VTVVAAGVHFVIVNGAVIAGVGFLCGKSVHICSEGVGFISALVKICAYSGTAEKGQFAAELFKYRNEVSLCFGKVSVQLGYHVKLSSVSFQ